MFSIGRGVGIERRRHLPRNTVYTVSPTARPIEYRKYSELCPDDSFFSASDRDDGKKFIFLIFRVSEWFRF